MGNAYKELKSFGSKDAEKDLEKGASGEENSTWSDIKNIGNTLKDSYDRLKSGEGDFPKKKKQP